VKKKVKLKISKVGDIDKALAFGTLCYILGLFSIRKIGEKFFFYSDLVFLFELFTILLQLKIMLILLA
jgi:hypothetical protein